MLGDPMGGLLPPMTASMMSPPALQMGFGIVNEDDPNPDVVLAALEPEPTLVVERGNGMGGLFFGTPTVLAQPAEVGDRFAFSPRTLGGMRAVAAGQGEVRRFGSTDGFMTSFYEDNPMRIGNTFVRELATDVSVRTFGSEDQETVMGIVNLSGWTVIARAEFDGAAADQVERWGLPEPSRRVVTNAFGSFDYVLGTDAAKVLVVRGDCYDAYELDAPANEIVIGDYDGRGGLDVAVGSDGGLTLLLTGI
jgi:hypothetical protein